MASAWPLHMAEAHQMSPVDVITRVAVITKGMGVHGPEGLWEGNPLAGWAVW